MDVLFVYGPGGRQHELREILEREGWLAGAVVQDGRRGEATGPRDQPDDEWSNRYSAERTLVENVMFGGDHHHDPTVPSLTVGADGLNAPAVRSFVRDLDPDLVLTWGVDILSESTLDAIPGAGWNVHEGLVPDYRGVHTHFWPCYMLEPQMTGVTVHELDARVDGGRVVHQSGPALSRGDGVCMLGARTVDRFLDADVVPLLRRFSAGELSPPVEQSRDGKVWYRRDFGPARLRHYYESTDDDLVTSYLDGELGDARTPDLVRQVEPDEPP